MIVVSDTTPLNYLILTESVHVLPALFGRVCVPSIVLAELSHAKSPEAVRAWAGGPPAWVVERNPTRIDPSLKLGPGESAAKSLALEIGAELILIDERGATRRPKRAVYKRRQLSAFWKRRLIAARSILTRRSIGCSERRPFTSARR